MPTGRSGQCNKNTRFLLVDYPTKMWFPNAAIYVIVGGQGLASWISPTISNDEVINLTLEAIQ